MDLDLLFFNLASKRFNDERETKPTEDGVPAPDVAPEFGPLPLPGVDSPVPGVEEAAGVEEAEYAT